MKYKKQYKKIKKENLKLKKKLKAIILKNETLKLNNDLIINLLNKIEITNKKEFSKIDNKLNKNTNFN